MSTDERLDALEQRIAAVAAALTSLAAALDRRLGNPKIRDALAAGAPVADYARVVDWSKFSTDELRTLLALEEKALGR